MGELTTELTEKFSSGASSAIHQNIHGALVTAVAFNDMVTLTLNKLFLIPTILELVHCSIDFEETNQILLKLNEFCLICPHKRKEQQLSESSSTV